MPRVPHGRPDLRPTTKEPARAGHGWTQWDTGGSEEMPLLLPRQEGMTAGQGPLLWIPGLEQALVAKGTERWLPAKDNAFRKLL